MLSFINKSLNIKAEEWPQLSVFGLMMFLFIIGYTWANITLSALFIVQVGVDFIPFMFIGDAIIVVFAFAIYAAFADRLSNARLLTGTSGLNAVGVVVGLVLIRFAPPQIAYPFLYLLFRGVGEVISNHWGPLLSEYYDAQAMKRVLSVLGSVNRITVIISALTIPLWNKLASPTLIITFWGTAWLMLSVLAIFLARWFKPPKAAKVAQPVQRQSYIESIQEGFRFVTGSSYLRAFAITSILLTAALAVLNIRAYEIFQAKLETQEAISNFTALITLVGSIIILPFQLFLFSRLVAKLGVGRLNLVFPSLTLSMCGLLVLFPAQLAVGALTFFNNSAINIAVRCTNDELLYNAVPLRVKGRTRAFIGGIVAPLGMLIGGVIGFLPFMSVMWIASIVMLIAGLGYFIGSSIVTRRYSQALIKLLQEENYASIFGAEANFVIDSASLNILKNKLAESANDSDKVFMARIISEAAGSDAVPILETLARQGSPTVRTGVIEILVDANNKAVHDLYLDLLKDDTAAVRRAALAGLERILGTTHEEYLNLALERLNDPDLEIRAYVLPALLKSTARRESALAMVDDLLNNPDAHQRQIGVQVLTKEPDLISKVIERLDDPAEEVRLEAVKGIYALGADVATSVRDPLAQHLLALIPREPVANIRVTAIRMLEWIPDSKVMNLVGELLADPSPRVRDAVMGVIQHYGTPMIPILEPLLNADNSRRHKMATVALAYLQKETYAPKVLALAQKNLRDIYANYAQLETLDQMTAYPSIGILKNVVKEYIDELQNEIFYMLAAVHSPEAIRAIQDALHSGAERSYANAVEALDVLVASPLSELLPPLFDARLNQADFVRIGNEKLTIEKSSANTTIMTLLNSQSTPWFRVITMFALGEMGAKVNKRSRRNPLDLLDGDKPADTPLFSRDEIQVMLGAALVDSDPNVRVASRAARRILEGEDVLQAAQTTEEHVLSLVERIIFLKGVPFFAEMTVNQLAIVATVCEEELFKEDTVIFGENTPGGTLYVVVSGNVGIERQDKATRTSARLRTVEAKSYFGESTFFNNSPTTTSAIAIQNTFVLRLRYEPLVALMQEYPDLSLRLIEVLSQRIRKSREKLADLSRQDQDDVKKVLDKLG